MQATKTFRTKLPRLFFVSNVDAVVRDISDQFRQGYVSSIGPDKYLADVFDVPAAIHMARGVLLNINYAS